MSSRSTQGPRQTGSGHGRVWVQDGTRRRPFMRGILIHSLMAQGVSYEDAYRAANAVRDRIRPLGAVGRREIARLAAEALGSRAPKPVAKRPAPLGPILVTGKGEGTPFSKGFLSQSLLAAAVDPHDAFDVAQHIEGELLRRDVREIDRRAVRRLTYETLCQRIGPEAGARYLVWRDYHNGERPLILLLGGTSGVGKTSLAHEVAHRLGISGVISTDSIRQVMRIMLSAELVPAIHASSYDAHTVLGKPITGSDPVIEGFQAQASIVAVGVRAMIDRAIAENTSLILDGVSIVPGLVGTEAHLQHADVIFLVVATLDEGAFRSRFAARAELAHQRPQHKYLEHLDAILRIQEHFLELAELHHVPIVNNESFDRSVLSIIRHVTETLRKRGNFDAAALLSH